MNFANATILSVSRKSEFLSNTVRYRSTLQLNVEGLLLELTNSSGVAYIISDLLDLQSQSDNWQDININGYNFGQGIISSISFSEGNDVRTKKYNVNITVPQDGDLSSVVGEDYTGLAYENIKYVEGFSESSTYDRQIKKETYSQSIKFSIRGPYSLDAVGAAQSLAADFFAHNDLINTVGNKYSDSIIYRKFYNESYDSINNRYEFSRNYETSTDSNGQYSVFRSHGLTFDQAGIANVKEKAEYIGHTSVPFDTVSQQANSDIQGAFGRCQTVFSAYLNETNASLLSTPITKSFASLPFDGKISYEVTFTNSNRVKDTYFWNYEISMEKTLGGNYIATEHGEVVGFGHIIEAKYNNALGAWNSSVKSGIQTRINSYYNGGSSLKLVTESTTLQKVQGKISYSNKYTDSDSIRNSTSVRKVVATISQQSSRHLISYFNIINVKEIAQVQPNTLPIETSFSIDMNGSAFATIGDYLPIAKSYVYMPGMGFIADANYSFDPSARSFKLSVSTLSFV